MRQQTLQQAQSLFALLVDGHLQRVAVGRHGAQRVARRHHPGSGGGQQAATWRVLMPAACSISSRWRCGCSSGAADTGPGDSSANGSSRDDSGARAAARSNSDGAATDSTGTGAGTGRFVGGGNGNGITGGRRKQRGVSVQLRPRQPRAGMPGAAVLHNSVARHRRHGRGSPRPHHRRTARPAVQAPAPIGARAPLAHPLHSALPAAQAAWFGQRNHGPDRGSDPDRTFRRPVRLWRSARSAPAKVVSNCAAEVILNSPLCRLARTHPCLRHSRIAWMRRCAAASVKRNSRTA